MVLNKSKIAMQQCLMFILILFTFGIISSKSINIIGNNVYVELGGVATIIFIIGMIFTALTNKKYDWKMFFKENKRLIIFISIFILFSLLNSLIIKSRLTFYVINKDLPLIGLIFLLFFLRFEKKNMIDKYYNFCSYIFIIAFALAIIMYFFGYTNGALSFDKGINLVDFKQSMRLFGEVRLYWLLSHKSRFVVYCILGMMFLFNNKNMNKILKGIGILLSLVCVILSQAMTGILIYALMFFVIICDKFNLFNKFKSYVIDRNNRKQIIISIVAIIVLIIAALGILSTKRDLSSLGSRTYIWQAAFQRFLEAPWGRIQIPEFGWIRTAHYGDSIYFTNAHNVYFNEFLENGIIGGILFLTVWIVIAFKYFKTKDYVFSIFLIVFLGVACNIEAVNSREMPYIICLAYALSYYKALYNNKNFISNKD